MRDIGFSWPLLRGQRVVFLDAIVLGRWDIVEVYGGFGRESCEKIDVTPDIGREM